MAYSDYSIDFAGGTSQEHVLLGNVLDINGMTDAFTWAFWAKPDQYASHHAIFICKQGGGPAYLGYQLSFDTSGRLGLFLIYDWATNDHIWVRSFSQVANVGEWAFYAVTSSGSGSASGITLYRNGYAVPKETVQDSLTGSTSSSNTLAFGMRTGDNDHEYDGHLDDILYYTAELTPSEVLDLAEDSIPLDPTVLGTWANNSGFWRMGDGDTYPTVLDHSTAVNNGTMTNMSSGNIVADAPALSVYPGYVLDQLSMDQSLELRTLVTGHELVLTGGGGVGPTQVYKMRAQDDGVAAPGYVTWISTGAPDFVGSGFPSADPTPVGSMVAGSATVVAQWEEY